LAASRLGNTPTRTIAADWGGCVTDSSDQGEVFRDDERLVALGGNAYFSDAELARLARERGAACALAEGYRRRGTAILSELGGDFALTIVEKQGRVLLAVDRTGTRVLNYNFNR